MNIMKKAYEQALDEDAVMGAGDAAPAGDVSAPTVAIDTDMVSSPGMQRDEIIGKYQPGKGVMGKDDFNIPKNVLGKGNILKRMGWPSKKPKNHKNPYSKNMKILTDDEMSDEQKQKLKDGEQIKKTKDIASKVKTKHDVKTALENFEKNKTKIDKNFNNSKFLEVKNGINDIMSMLKDFCNGSYKCQWSTIAILTAVLIYVVSPVDLIPDVLPVVGVVDDAAVIMWALKACKDELDNYRSTKNKKIGETELDKDLILAIQRTKESELRNFILKFFRDEIYDAMYVQAIVYFPTTQTFFAKVENDGKWSYVNLDFKNGKFTITDDLNVYSTNEILQKYRNLHGMKGWVVWGGLNG